MAFKVKETYFTRIALHIVQSAVFVYRPGKMMLVSLTVSSRDRRLLIPQWIQC